MRYASSKAGPKMTKRTTCLVILLGGVALFLALVQLGGRWTYPPGILQVLAQMIIWGAISASVAAALTPGRWNEPVNTAPNRTRRLPHWLWPTLFVFLAVANYLVALAVLLGASAFAMPTRSE